MRSGQKRELGNSLKGGQHMDGQIIQWVIIFAIFAVVIWYFTRPRRRMSQNVETTIALLREIDTNLKIINQRRQNPDSTKKFRTTSGRHAIGKTDYLNPDMVKRIDEMYKTLNEMNEAIESAKQTKNTAMLHSLSFDNLEKEINKNRSELIEWLREDYESSKK
jgi:RecA/RadA recombinase